MARLITFQNTEKIKKIVKTQPAITQEELMSLTGMGKNTLNMYLSRGEFSHIIRKRRTVRFIGMTESDVKALEQIACRDYITKQGRCNNA